MSDFPRIFDHQVPRVESGPIQFGTDWPGIFLRGDEALAMSFYLGSVTERLKAGETIDPLSIAYLDGLARNLGQCRT